MAQTAVAGRNIQDANHKVAHSFFLRALPARLSLLCRYGVPADFCGCRLVEVSCVKSGGDEDAAELAVHAGGGGWGLSAVPGSPVRCSVTSAGSWAVCQLQVIPAQRAYCQRGIGLRRCTNRATLDSGLSRQVLGTYRKDEGGLRLPGSLRRPRRTWSAHALSILDIRL